MPSTLLFVSGEPGVQSALCSFPACVLREGFSDVKALAQRSHPSLPKGMWKHRERWSPVGVHQLKRGRVGIRTKELGSAGTWVTGVSDSEDAENGRSGGQRSLRSIILMGHHPIMLA